MNAIDIRDLQTAISRADWNLGLDKFAEAIGSDPRHNHTREKFREFQALNKALNRFDAETLVKVLEAGQSK